MSITILILAYVLRSWTDQQRAAAAKEGWGYRLVFTARLVINLFPVLPKIRLLPLILGH